MNLKKENLFLIEHINEEEKILEKQVKESAKNILEKEKEVLAGIRSQWCRVTVTHILAKTFFLPWSNDNEQF